MSESKDKVSHQKDNFTEELLEITSKTALCLAINLGSKLGLIETLSQFDSPAPAKEIADRAGLKERYVKEWLSILATGGILNISQDGSHFFLPVCKRAALLGQEPLAMQALFMMEVLPPIAFGPTLGKLLEVCRKDGPSGLEFQGQPADDITMYSKSGALAVQQMTNMFDGVPLLQKSLESGIRVLELGCNIGVLSRQLAQLHPKSSFTGIDIDKHVVTHANKMASESHLTNINFQVQDVCNLPKDWSEKFDYVFAYKVIHDLGEPRRALQDTYRVLKPGGRFSLFEYNVSSNPAENVGNNMATPIYLGSFVHCVPYSVGLNNGESLGACWGVAKMKSYLADAAFKDIQVADESSRPLVHIVGSKVQ